MSYRLCREIDPGRYEAMLTRGWRRFGNQFFRPTCPSCARCRSIRVDVAGFAPTKSQRRTLKLNHDVRVEIRPPSVTPRHVELYNSYHAFMALEKGWPFHPISEEDYAQQFIGSGFPFAREFLYFLDSELVAVGLVDVVTTLSSSLYFFHHPSHRSRSLGVFSLLEELAHARAHGIQYHHLGYWIPECDSMRYKSNYKPFELLVGYPLDHEQPQWVPETDWIPVLNTEPIEMIL